MSEHRFTPGPWLIDRRAATHVVSANGRGVAPTGGVRDSSQSDNGEAENLANARLIASAPDMLETLTEADKTLCALQANIADAQKREPRWEGVWDEIEIQRVAIKAAIAKATGASHE